MKIKSAYLTNFKYKPSALQDNLNSLTIERLINTKTNQGSIQTAFSESDIFDSIFDKNKSLSIKSINKEILNKTTKIIPYEYFDESKSLKQLRLFIISNDNNLYELDNENLLLNYCYTFSIQPKIIQSNNTLYLFDLNNKCVIIEENNLLTTENIPQIKNFTTNKTHTIFVLNEHPNKIFFSELCELKNISSNTAQYSCISVAIEDGHIRDIFCLKNNIYVFTNYSILKLDLTNNCLEKQNELNLFIYKDSLKQVDDSIYFYSTNGLYIFDGLDIRQIFDNKLNLSKNANFVYFNHKLYILDMKNKNIIFEYNFSDDSLFEIKIDNLVDFYQIKNISNYSLAVNKIEDEKYLTTILDFDLENKNFLTQITEFKPLFLGSNSQKILKQININSEGQFQLKIFSDISSSEIFVSDSNKNFNIDLTGTFFKLEIKTSSYFKLNSILISFTEIGD